MPISSHLTEAIEPGSSTRHGPQADLSVLLLMQQASTLDQSGQSAAAENLYRQVLDLQPDKTDALDALSRIAFEAGRMTHCVDLLDRAIDLGLQDAALYRRRGAARASLGRHRDALADFDLALVLEPEKPELARQRLSCLFHLHRNEEALAGLTRLLEAGADDGQDRTGAAAEGTAAQTEESIAAADGTATAAAGVDAAPDGSDAQKVWQPYLPTAAALERAAILQLRGNVLAALERHDEALADYDQALTLVPEQADTLQSKAELLASLNRHEEAAAGFAMAVRIRPNMPEIHLNEGLSRLAAGDFANGWKKYEWRWQTARLGQSRRVFEQPLWLGRQSLAGKTILLHAEQRLEDTIQFCRYARRAAAQGATVLLEAPASIVPLLRGLDGVEQVYAEGEPLPAFDFHCPLLSLPLAFGTTLPTIPVSTGYLKADPELTRIWQQRLGESPLLRVGLYWSDPRDGNEARTIALENFSSLVYGRANYLCLQTEIALRDLPVLERRREIRRVDDILADPATDISDLAALIASLDLVVATDSVVAHLAAAMGKPVWLLLSARPGWRWMLERRDSPWYPSMKLFRQSTPHDWDGVVAAVARELDKWRA